VRQQRRRQEEVDGVVLVEVEHLALADRNAERARAAVVDHRDQAGGRQKLVISAKFA
jgi:hypothetical protein